MAKHLFQDLRPVDQQQLLGGQTFEYGSKTFDRLAPVVERVGSVEIVWGGQTTTIYEAGPAPITGVGDFDLGQIYIQVGKQK